MRSRPLAAAWPLLALCVLLTSTTVTDAAPEGQVTYAFHVTLAPRWLDPGETESAITSFKVLYAIHDALVKPMPTGQMTPNLGRVLGDGAGRPELHVRPAPERQVSQRRSRDPRGRQVLVRPI